MDLRRLGDYGSKRDEATSVQRCGPQVEVIDQGEHVFGVGACLVVTGANPRGQSDIAAMIGGALCGESGGKRRVARLTAVSHYLRRALVGAAAGTVATLPMSALMLAARRAGWLSEQTPERITRLLVERTTGEQPDGTRLDAVTVVVHLSIGAAAGAAYATVLEPARPRGVPPALLGAGFGIAFWLASYWGVLPALGLMPTPPRDERLRPQVMHAAHWVYGGLLGILTARHGRESRPVR